MKQQQKKVLALFLIGVFFLSFSMDSLAASYTTVYGTPAPGTYNYVGQYNDTAGGNIVNIYKHGSIWYHLYYSYPLTPIVQHVSGTGKKELTVTTRQTISSQTTVSYNAELGMTIGSDLVKISVDLGIGSTTVTGKTFSVSSTVASTIPQNAKTGFYRLVPARTLWKVEADRQSKNSPYCNIYYYDMPYGEPFICTVYSADNASWSIWSNNN